MIEVGQKVTCKPYLGLKAFEASAQDEEHEGVVTYVNKMNRWFQVEYHKTRLRTSFKFDEIGRTVKLV